LARSKSSNSWLAEHFSDEYVKRAQKEGYRSRAVYKLRELDERDRLFRPGMTVVDLGAAPGGWSQYAKERVGAGGRVIALDILPMDALPGVECLTADFTEPDALAQLQHLLRGRNPDLVISDMAPNISGVGPSDQGRSSYLLELAMEFAESVLVAGGAFVSKAFQGAGFSEAVRKLRSNFDTVSVRKPRASRARSKEVYLVAKGFRRD
jgi:23S rRNA (uridine2552-2'-O)-methyltransferase